LGDDKQGQQPLDWILSAEAADAYQELLAEKSVDGRGDAAKELLTAGFVVLDPVTDLLVALPPEVPIVRSLASMTHLWLSQRPDTAAVERDLALLARQDRRFAQRTGTSEVVEEFSTREQRSMKINATFTGARSELSIMQPDVSPDIVNNPEQLTFAPEDLVKRGITIRFLYERSVLDDESFLRAALEESEIGVLARVTATIPSQALLIDRSALLIMNCDAQSTAVYTTAEPMVRTYLHLFDTMWTTAIPIGITNLSPDDNLSESHKMVLSNVMAGRPNDVIARILKMHPRTVRRRVDELCEVFGVDNRAALISAALHRLRD
jgi:DNA-binding CsgD family transcriptional regulator